MKPKFITFTGVDRNTDLDECLRISKEYPVEWGVLLSRTRDDNRYTGCHNLTDMAALKMPLSLHLCGIAARDAIASMQYPSEAAHVLRVQVNLRDKHYSQSALTELAKQKPTIMQTRNSMCWPDTPQNVYPLLDQSGGRGKPINAWPATAPDKLVGYAGGLSPVNVADFVQQVSKQDHEYWVDMETGVRTDDWFDLDKCRQVCEQVYGETK